MSETKENEKPQFSMSMFASREDLFKAQMDWEIKEAVSQERERCAKICETRPLIDAGRQLAEAIRKGD